MALGKALGRTVAPWRFVLFAVILLAAGVALVPVMAWQQGLMAAFDLAALAFFMTLPSLLRSSTNDMRAATAENDANRPALLAISVAVNFVVLVAVGSELTGADGLKPLSIALIVGTLLLAWLFANMVYTLHYAHIYYMQAAGGDGDRGGLDFPGTSEPNYWDFLYFSVTLGMTFQTSDIQMTTTHMRVIAILHSFAAFIFNLGVIAFTINILGSAS